jgi:hypothetical protein
MADLSDVENAIVSEVTGALYPQGVSQASIVGITCRVYRGWPSTAALNSDLAAGIVNVTVFPATVPDEVRDAYFDRLYVSIPPTSLAATVTGQSVMFSGPVVSGQVVGLLVDGVPYSYGINAGDTNESIAANLAALIGTNRIVTLSSSTLTIPDSRALTARVVTSATVSEVLRRQRREIQVSCWCPSPALRDSVSIAVDLALTASAFINLADETKAHVHYVSTQVYDQSQTALLSRRDLRYMCEYTIISSTAAPVMLFGDLFSNGSGRFV